MKIIGGTKNIDYDNLNKYDKAIFDAITSKRIGEIEVVNEDKDVDFVNYLVKNRTFESYKIDIGDIMNSNDDNKGFGFAKIAEVFYSSAVEEGYKALEKGGEVMNERYEKSNEMMDYYICMPFTSGFQNGKGTLQRYYKYGEGISVMINFNQEGKVISSMTWRIGTLHRINDYKNETSPNATMGAERRYTQGVQEKVKSK